MSDPMPEAAFTPENPDSPAAPPPLDTSRLSPASSGGVPADDATPDLEQLHCPHCGSTQLDQDSNGVWHCRFCRGTFRADDPAMIVVASPNVQRAGDPVIDTADLLTGEQEQRLTERFRQLGAQHGVVLVLETVNTITENVDLFARRRAQELGVGDDAIDNGIYILLVDHPHHVHVVAGDGLAARLPHATIQQIVDDTMIPAFRGGDYVAGVGEGAAQLAAAAAGQPMPMRAARPGASAPAGSPQRTLRFWMPFIIIVAGVILVMVFTRGGGGGSGFLDFGGGGTSDWGGSDWGGSDWGGSDWGGSDFGGGDFGGGSSGGGDW